MTYAQLVQMYFERSTALQWYWTIYVLVIGGLLAFSSLRTRKDWITGVLVTVLFCFFAYKNCGAIGDLTAQRQAIIDTIKALDATGGGGYTITSTLVNPAFEGLRIFHITTDVLTIAAIWAMELRRIRAARAEAVAQAESARL